MYTPVFSVGKYAAAVLKLIFVTVWSHFVSQINPWSLATDTNVDEPIRSILLRFFLFKKC